MVGATYAIHQILALTIIYVPNVIKFSTKNASNLQIKSNILTILNILSNFPFHCLTYVCLGCDFVAHDDCMYSPHIIKISRHHHRISYTPSLRSQEWSCGVFCRKSIDGDYGAYTCHKCNAYAVHSRFTKSLFSCSRKHVWDGRDLEGVPEKDDTTKDVESFKRTSKGVILHFLHN
ncbi:unnamed protein product [Arabidopsis halleri]